MTLPQYEMLEQGSQIRKSSKSICSNIAEGYGRKKYKMDFIKHLTYAHASCDETIVHLEMIKLTHTVESINTLLEEYDKLGRKINKYIRYVNSQWNKLESS
jgi:four helix bundle protein